MPGNRPCPPGCDCWKHAPRSYSSANSCAPGCTCSRHRTQACPVGCTCKRHRGGVNLSPAEKVERRNKRRKEAREADPEKFRAWERKGARAYRDANREEINEKKRARRASSPDRGRDERRFARHGLRPGDYAQLWEEQAGCCCYCGDELPREPKKVHVEHDHICCAPGFSCSLCRRGLACSDCNHVLGQARDDPDRLERIAANLRRLKAEVRGRIAMAPVQGELFSNVIPLERREAAG